MGADRPAADRAWGWVAHLREGGTRPWSRWLAEGTTAAPSGRVVPGAQQLELLRRLNELGAPSAALRDRVLTTSAVGRGQPDLELAGAVAPSRFGARPVDPADLPETELLRVAASLLAEDVVALGLAPVRAPLPRPWRAVVGRGYHLVGDPLVADQVRYRLIAQGRPPGGRRPLAIVAAAPLDRMLADTWTRRCLEQGVVPWPEWVRGLRSRRRLPPRVDLPAVAAAWASRVGRDQVRIVLDERQVATAAVPGAGGRRTADVVRPGADAAELARRLASVLGVLVTAQRREELLTHTLWPRLPATATPPPGVPEEHRDWVADRAAAMARRLRRDGYPVVGDPALLAAATGGTADPGSTPVLGLALRMLMEGLAGHTALDEGRTP